MSFLMPMSFSASAGWRGGVYRCMSRLARRRIIFTLQLAFFVS